MSRTSTGGRARAAAPAARACAVRDTVQAPAVRACAAAAARGC